MGARVDLTGQRFGWLIAQRQIGKDPTGHAVWLCLCACGKESSVNISTLTSGKATSCGCRKTYLANKKRLQNTFGRRRFGGGNVPMWEEDVKDFTS